MVKHEIKVEFNNTDTLKSIIEKTYFEEGFKGKILGKKHYLTIEDEDDVNYAIFKGLNNATVKLLNESIDGSIRVLVDETQGDIRLYPISIYCVKDENEKYSFY